MAKLQAFEDLRADFNAASSFDPLRDRLLPSDPIENGYIVEEDTDKFGFAANSYFTEKGRQEVYEQLGGSDENLTPSREYVEGVVSLAEEGSDVAVEGESVEQTQQAAQQQVTEDQRRRAAKVTPKITAVDADNNTIVEVQPSVVTRFGGTVPFDEDSNQLQDGQTVTDQRGDMNIHLNMEFEATQQQLATLAQMRKDVSNNNSPIVKLKVVSAFGTQPATFDKMKFDQIPDSNGIVTNSGDSREGARYTIQLQSKEQSENDSIIQPFSN